MSDLPVTETARAAAAFERYCALGPGRSLRKLARILEEEGQLEAGFPLQSHYELSTVPQSFEVIFRQLNTWSSAHRWQERVRAYDKEKAQEREQARAERIRQVNEQHITLARGQTVRAIKEIEHLAQTHRLTGQAAVTLFKYAVDLERAALGIPTVVQEQTFSVSSDQQDDTAPDLAALIRNDPEATRLVCLLYDRMAQAGQERGDVFGLAYFLTHRERAEQSGASLDSSEKQEESGGSGSE